MVLGHAYSLLCGKEVFDRSGNEIRLALLRNPHGEGEATADGIFSTKWRGHWSDTSPLWAKHPEIALSVDFNPANDGVFWISWDDFSVIFDKVCRSHCHFICHLGFDRTWTLAWLVSLPLCAPLTLKMVWAGTFTMIVTDFFFEAGFALDFDLALHLALALALALACCRL